MKVFSNYANLLTKIVKYAQKTIYRNVKPVLKALSLVFRTPVKSKYNHQNFLVRKKLF